MCKCLVPQAQMMEANRKHTSSSLSYYTWLDIYPHLSHNPCSGILTSREIRKPSPDLIISRIALGLHPFGQYSFHKLISNKRETNVWLIIHLKHLIIHYYYPKSMPYCLKIFDKLSCESSICIGRVYACGKDMYKQDNLEHRFYSVACILLVKRH
mgnify:CR=1 FL=1